jgi:NADPH2:quinone reductase
MSRAIRIHQVGGPEVLRFEDLPVGDPGPGELRIRQGAIAVNFVDIYHRTGLYPLPLPATLGVEAAGTVEAVGAGVTSLRAGDRVAYTGPIGAYAEARVVVAERCVKLPDGLDDRTAAAVFTKGLTAQALLRRTHPVKAGETVLVHAAAGGVGLLMVQWAKALGATVIGTVGSDEKAALARANGCDHVIVYTREEFPKRVRELTGGAGVPVVYDSVGQATFQGSLDCLAPLGMMVTFGNASGPVPPLDVRQLAARGSLFLTRPSVFAYISTRPALEAAAAELFEVLRTGAVRPRPPRVWPLAEAAAAHRALEARETTGSVVLAP